MNFIKKYYLYLILIISFILYLNFAFKNPCDSTIKYRIGQFDKRFNLSKVDFLKSIQQAESIWEKESNKELFKYDQNAKLTINLIYDDRQKSTQQNQILEADINKTNNLAESLKDNYASLEYQYKLTKSEYELAFKSFQEEQINYNSQVEYWNNLGGAPRDEYRKLQILKDDLSVKQNLVESKRIEVNNLATQINDFIHKYNLLIENANTKIEKINTNAGEEFEEGIYSPSNNQIIIYQFSDKNQLTRVLAHEFGHALGLDHVTNQDSIMYPLNKNTSLVLSIEDKSEIKSKCGLK